jgi:hypothetical protein
LAFLTDPFHDESVSFSPEPVFLSRLFANLTDLVVAEFDNRIALGAVQVVVRGVTKIVLIN